MDCIAHGVTKNQIELSNLHFQANKRNRKKELLTRVRVQSEDLWSCLMCDCIHIHDLRHHLELDDVKIWF